MRDRLCRELVVLPFAQEGLQGSGPIAAAHDNDSDRAARLAGAVTEDRYGLPEDAVDARIEATFIEPTRIRIGTDAWGEAFQEGAALSFEEAIAYVLDETRA